MSNILYNLLRRLPHQLQDILLGQIESVVLPYYHSKVGEVSDEDMRLLVANRIEASMAPIQWFNRGEEDEVDYTLPYRVVAAIPQWNGVSYDILIDATSSLADVSLPLHSFLASFVPGEAFSIEDLS